MIRTIKRFYHPGLKLPNTKLCLPICPVNEQSTYYKPVHSNKVQEIQLNLENKFSYETNNINCSSYRIFSFLKENIMYLPTSHNTPVSTALKSLRNINPNKFLEKMDKTVVDGNGVFVDNEENRNKLLQLMNYCESDQEKNIIESAIYGIFSNFGDSIYIANDYLNVGKNKIIVANYPDKVSGREIEKCGTIAYSLLNGNYPVLLDKHVNFEGEANIKFIPAIILENGIRYQLCISYNSSRSSVDCIENMNKYLRKLGHPLLKDICFSPEKGIEQHFYHLDCILNFYCTSEYQYFENINDFWENYKRNGTITIEMNKIKNKEKVKQMLHKIFMNIIEVDYEDDLLCANMIMTRDGIIGSSNLTNQNDFLEINKSLFFNHPSTGGGGAHKCCSNVLEQNSPIKLDEWAYFSKYYNIDIDQHFLEGVEQEIERIKHFTIMNNNKQD